MTDKTNKNAQNQSINDPETVSNVFDECQWISIEDIDCSERLRPIDSVYVEALAASIVKDGLLHPIDICKLPNQKSGKPYRLVAGGHRVAAVQRLVKNAGQYRGFMPLSSQQAKLWNATIARAAEFGAEFPVKIPAFIRSHEADARRAREIAENIFNAPLKPYERAKFIGELVAIERRRIGLSDEDKGQKAGALARWENANKKDIASGSKDASDTMSFAYGFNSVVATKLNMTPRTIQRSLELLRIPPSLIDALDGNEILENGNALRAISKLEPNARQEVIADLVKGEKFAVAIAPHNFKPAIVTDAQAAEEQFFKDFKKLPSHVQDAYLARIAPLVEGRWSIEKVNAND